jgi:5-methylcytosine-specific restriction endonuclease McrBC regulatory subunit McrC
MDIVLSEVNSGRAVAVIDAKYKADSEPSPQDVYQAVAYATQLGINHAVLVYPVATTGPRSDRIGSVQITAIGYDIGSAMAASRTKFIADLSTAIARQL